MTRAVIGPMAAGVSQMIYFGRLFAVCKDQLRQSVRADNIFLPASPTPHPTTHSVPFASHPFPGARSRCSPRNRTL